MPTTPMAVKTLSYLAAPAIGAYLTTLGINHGLIYGLFAMMGLDMVSAILMWLRVDPKRIKSSVFKKGMTEKFASLIPAGVIFIMLLAFDQNSAMLLNGYISLLLLAEAYSTISNTNCAYTRVVKEEYDAVSEVLKWVKKKISNMLMAGLKDDSDKPSKTNNTTKTP